MTSFSAEIHFCQGKFKSVSFIGHASCGTCDKKEEHKGCKYHKSENPCCETTILQHESADDFLNNPADFNVVQSVDFVIVYTLLDFALFTGERKTEVVIDDYAPPLPNRDIPVLVRSLLI